MFNLSPISHRRWMNFKANARGFWSLRIFLVLFFLTLPAEFIANDKPMFIWSDKGVYFPVFQNIPETEFGGEFQTKADYRDPFVQDLIRKQNGVSLWPPIRYHHQTVNLNLPESAPARPSWLLDEKLCTRTDGTPNPTCKMKNWNWLGTDGQGRDVLARVIYGFRLSVLFGLTLTIISSIIGMAAGAIQGFFGGWVDLGFQRFIEIWTSIPSLYLLITIANVIEPSFWVLLGILLLFSWVALVGVVRAEFLRARNYDYVRAARALGVSTPTLMLRHILPNALVATITFMPFLLNGSISTLTSLDFLGFGLPPGSPSLGEILAQSRSYTNAPWLGLTGFIVLASLLSLLIFIGEAARDAFDPRKNGVR